MAEYPLNIGKTGNPENETDNEDEKNPLKNPLILDHVFKYLSLKDIKSCREVCKVWNGVSTSVQEKMATVILYPESGNTSQVETKTPTAFTEFSETSGIFYNSFKLKSSVIFESKWTILALRRFFEDQRQNIRKLVIDNINVASIWRFSLSNDEMYYYDRISLQMRSDYRYLALDPYIDNNLTHLAIDNSLGSKFIVSMDKLIAAKSLLLKNCALKVVNNSRLAPEKLEISHVAILKDDFVMETVAVEELFDLENLKELTLDGGLTCRLDWCFHGIWYHYKTSKLSIKAKKMSLKNLFLKSVEIENIEEAEWQISGLFTLRNVPFENYTKINFTKMDFGNSTINLAALPLSVEKLVFTKLENQATHIISPQYPRVTLPNLKYLEIKTHRTPFCRLCHLTAKTRTDFDEGELHFGQNFLRYLILFGHCQNLTNLKLQCTSEDSDLCLSTAWVPSGIKHLTLIGEIRTVGKEIEIETLVLENDNFENLATCVSKLHSEHLVLDLNSQEIKQKDLENFIVPLIEMPYKTLAIGGLITSIRNFQKSSFSKLIDNMGDFYIFEKGRGRSIEKPEFEKLKKEQ